MNFDYDVIVLGAGSGGCATAIRSTDLGRKALIIEKRVKGGIGGTCINRGCIPTKALLRAVTTVDELKKAKSIGIKVDGYSVDIKKIMSRRAMIQSMLGNGLRMHILGGRDIPVMFGDTTLQDGNTVKVITDKGEEKTLTAKNIVIATGSEPMELPAFNVDRKNIVTSDETLTMTEAPESMIIVGGGHIGIEMGLFYATMGTKITIVEALPVIASAVADEEVCEMVKKMLESRGITVLTNVMIDTMKVTGEKEVTAYLKGGETLVAEKALVSIGRVSNLQGLGLEEVGVKIEKGRIVTNEMNQSSIESIYAVGDVAPGTQLSSKAQSEGLTIAEIMAGKVDTRLDYDVLPWTIFYKPEITKVGLSRSEAEAQGIEIIEGVLPMSANEKALCNAATEGIVKIVADKNTHKILGGIVVCEGASNMIAEIATAMRGDMTVDTLAETMHSHPTYSEAILECAKNAIGTNFHK